MINKIRNNQFIRNSSVLFIGTVVISFLSYIFHLMVGRMADPQVFGEFESLNSLYMIISVPAVALVMFATKYSAHTKAENDTTQAYHLMNFLNKKVFLYVSPFFVIALILTPAISDFLKIESRYAVIFLWIMMFVSFVGAVNIGILNGWQKFANYNWASIFGILVKLISAFIFIKIGFAINGITGSFALGALASYLGTFYALNFIVKGGHDSQKGFRENFDLKSMRSFVWPVLLGNLSLAILGNADMIVAKHNLDLISAGQYGALTIISKTILTGTNLVATVLFSMAAEKTHQKGDAIKIFLQASILVLIMCLGGIVAFFLFPQLILGLFFGDKYLSISNYLGWFAVLVSLFSFVNLISQYLLSIHQTRFIRLYLIISSMGVVAILLAGKSFFAILELMIVIQVAAILAGAYYLYQTNGTKKDFHNCASV